jgi:disulfide bond formation protein DsbB
MTPSLSATLNALGLIAIAIVLSAAFADQLLYQDLPCPLCLLQRAGLTAAGFGIALNLLLGPRPSHYGVAILGALVGLGASVRQILLHIVPGTGSYGDAIFGLHLYTWALMIFGLIVAGCSSTGNLAVVVAVGQRWRRSVCWLWQALRC